MSLGIHTVSPDPILFAHVRVDQRETTAKELEIILGQIGLNIQCRPRLEAAERGI